MQTRQLQLAIRVVLAAVFAYAAIAKAWPSSASNPPWTIFASLSQSVTIRRSVMCAEAILAIWLVTGFEVKVAGVVTLTILSAFTGLIVLELGHDLPKPCGCMGASNALMDAISIRRSLHMDLIRNLMLMIAASSLYLWSESSKATIGFPRIISAVVRRSAGTHKGVAI